jgi:asparagine synthase (glutamine-hydrolysing)
MSTFACCVSPAGKPNAAWEGAVGLAERFVRAECSPLVDRDAFHAVAADGTLYDSPVVATLDHFVAVGDARLANRKRLERELANRELAGASDVEIALRCFVERGGRGIEQLIGDFALVIWDSHNHCLHLWRDPIGTLPLFFRTSNRQIFVASRASLLTAGHQYDREFIADCLAMGRCVADRTMFGDVSWVPAGHHVRWEQGGRLIADQYWSVESFDPDGRISLADASVAFREVFQEAVHFSLTGKPDTWSSLSGGLDSSSIVVVAQHLHRIGAVQHGLSGTISLYDTLGDADERHYSEAVVLETGVRNEVDQFGWPWQDFSSATPVTDLPAQGYAMITSNRRHAATVLSNGGRVFLTGFGADNLMGREHSMLFLADLLASGRVRECFREAMRWSIVRRASVWRTLWSNAVYPLLPEHLRIRNRSRVQSPIPHWITSAFRKECDFEHRLPAAVVFRAKGRRKYLHQVAFSLAAISKEIYPSLMGDELPLRHPFLYKPLVELLLRLPVAYRVQPRAAKFILRESLRDLLPEVVRTRTSKGGTGTRIYWSLSAEIERIKQLVKEPLLADMGIIDAAALRRALGRAQRGIGSNFSPLLMTLSLETWLRMRSGRWTDMEPQIPLEVALT